MNIWQWIENLQKDLAAAGQAHSAQLIDDFSSEICDEQAERADALLPEARALAHTLQNPWLEVFIGHWEMRNRLGNKGEGEAALADVVSLFEKAHRPEAIDCPQSVCVTQDLSSCYAIIDGPGWAAERIAVCDETLARITPKWGCYQCISIERSEAMLDAGDAQAAYDYLAQQVQAVEASGESVNAGVVEFRIKLLIALHRYEEALAIIAEEEAKADGAPEWANIKRPRDTLKAKALALLGRDDEALEALPALRDIATPSGYCKWLDAIHPVLLRRPELNDWSLASRMQQGLDDACQKGAHRRAIAMAALCIRLALARGALWTAKRQLAKAREVLPKLRVDAGAAALLAELEAQIQAQPEPPLPVAPDALLAWLEAEAEAAPDAGRNPENEVQWLMRALEARPDDVALRRQASEALQACGAGEEAIACLRQGMARVAQDDGSLGFALLALLLQAGRVDEVETLAQWYDTHGSPDHAAWCRAQRAWHERDWDGVIRHGEAVLAASPDSHGARQMQARALMQAQRFAEAAVLYRQLAEALPDNANPRWDFMTASSAAGDWAAVREMATAIGFEGVEAGDAPLDEHWGWVIVRYLEKGEPMDYYARRTGPVSAQVVENAPPQFIQRSGDRVAYDAEMLFPAPEDEEARQHFIPTFMAVHVTEPGGYGSSRVLRAPHPGEELLQALREAVQARGWNFWNHSGEDYQLPDLDAGEDVELPAVLLTVAAPADVAALDIHRALVQWTADWPYPASWLALANEAEADVAAQERLAERYGLL